MKKIYQTNTTKGSGNCVAACVASILDLNLEDVPELAPDEHQMTNLINFMKSKGYRMESDLWNKQYQMLFTESLEYCHNNIIFEETLILNNENLGNLEGINGLFLASVLSPKYFCFATGEVFAQHMVIIDKNMNIVHDPNVEYSVIFRYPMEHLIGYNGIISIHNFHKI